MTEIKWPIPTYDQLNIFLTKASFYIMVGGPGACFMNLE